MQNLKIFVCSHKPVPNILHDDVYIPIHLERVNSPYKEEMKEYVGDDTGDNISGKGRYYSEGTAIYWIWKNVHDCKYVGLSQYRRQFDYHFTNDNIEGFFADGTDVIMSKKWFRSKGRFYTVLTYMQMEDFLILRGVMKKIYPNYLQTLHSFLKGRIDYPFNMVICKKELYNQYAEWVFTICNEMEKYVRYSSYSNSSRLFGYVIELLTPVFFIHNNCKIKTMNIAFEGKRVHFPSWRQKVAMSIFQATIWRYTRNKNLFIDPSFYRGLMADGIDLDCTYDTCSLLKKIKMLVQRMGSPSSRPL